MRSLFPLFSLILFPICNIIAQNTKPVQHHIETAVQIVSIDCNKHLVLDFDAENLEVVTTKGSRVIVEMTVKFDAPSDAVANFIMKTNRYEVELLNDDKCQRLAAKSKGQLIVMGQELQENVSYKIFVPEKALMHKQQEPLMTMVAN